MGNFEWWTNSQFFSSLAFRWTSQSFNLDRTNIIPMDLLDLLLAAPPKSESPEKDVEDLALKISDSQESSQDMGGSWIQGGSGKEDESSKKVNIEFWDTKIKPRVHPDRLVWAKNNWYSGKKFESKTVARYFPARVCDDDEGMYLKIEWPIPSHLRLIEFINIPKNNPATPEKLLVDIKDIIPFHENTRNNKSNTPPKSSSSSSPSNKRDCASTLMSKSNQTMLNFSVKSNKPSNKLWNINSIQNMKSLLSIYYPRNQDQIIENAILKKSNEYLETSLNYLDEIEKFQFNEKRRIAAEIKEMMEESQPDSLDAISNDDDDNSISDMNQYARSNETIAKEKNLLLSCDQWICYQHKLFKKLMYTRIVEINKLNNKYHLIVENGEILGSNDQIRILNTKFDHNGITTYDDENGSSYKSICEYKAKKGKSKTLKTLHESAAIHAKEGGMIELGNKRKNNETNSSTFLSEDNKKKQKSTSVSVSVSTAAKNSPKNSPKNQSPKSPKVAVLPKKSPSPQNIKSKASQVAPKRITPSALVHSDIGTDSDSDDPFA
jgi:hypothetical protein